MDAYILEIDILWGIICTFPFHSSSYPMNQRLPLNNISNQFKNEICECSVRKLSSEKENIKFNFTGLNKSRHGENFNQVFYWSSSVTISGNEETLPTFESKDHFNFGERPKFGLLNYCGKLTDASPTYYFESLPRSNKHEQ
ncbi:hypothetical protein Avbf_05581 [Armadillidium vulgare]|nr:hypothetical protein Avbf_05581 [Armadillidium vulgare]